MIVGVLAGLGTQLNPSEAPLKNFPGTGTAIAGRQMLADARISPGVMKPLDVLVEHGGNAQQVAAKLRRRARGRRGERAPHVASWPRLAGRGVPVDRRVRPRHPGDHRSGQRRAQGDGRDADRRRRGRPRLRARPVRQLPVRARVRPAAHPDPARPGVSLDRAGDQGRAAQRPLARRGVRGRRLRLPARTRLVAVERRRDPVRSRPTSR